ncbi:MAG: hypothetical protein A2X48_06540 [Lentisphaerae bacterium GWF2_49_21]|nr:MAG: hypothetical protein A2X48_06540 [Lentisphaerae bacterium GWF2_49_21]
MNKDQLKKNKVYGLLKGKIDNGEYPNGHRLPPERELAKNLDVSMSTLRSSLDRLEKEGMLDRVRSQGTFVTLNVDRRQKLHGRIACIMRPIIPGQAENNFLDALNASLSHEILKNGFQLVVPPCVTSLSAHHPSSDACAEIACAIGGLQGFVDGIIVEQRIPDSALERFAETSRPMVILDRNTDLKIDSVTSDHGQAVKMQVELALKAGYGNFLVCRIDRFQNDRLRFQELNKVLLSRKVPKDKINVVEGWMESNAGELLQKIFEIMKSNKDRKVMVFAGDDALAIFLCERLERRGYVIGSDVGVMGFGGFAGAVVNGRALTTVRMDPLKLAAKAVEILLDRINGNLHDPRRTHNVETQLELGNTI